MNTTEVKIDIRKINAAIIELPNEDQYVVFLGNTGEVGEIFDTSYCADGKIAVLEKVQYPSSILHGLKNKIYHPSDEEIEEAYNQIFNAVFNTLEDGETVISLKDKEVV